MRAVRTILICALVVGHAGAACAQPRFVMHLGVSNTPNHFGPIPATAVALPRVYPGEALAMVLSGDIRDADASGLDNATLVSQLQVCMLAGDHLAELSTTAAVTCSAPSGVSWQITAQSSGYTMSADIRSTSLAAPTGVYTVFVALPSTNVVARLGAHAPGQLRSGCALIEIGAASNSDEVLSHLMHTAFTAAQVDDYASVKAAAESILASYPSSVFALCYLGEAKSFLGDTPGAIAAYEQALVILEADGDTRSRPMHDPRIKTGKRREITGSLADLQGEGGQ